MMNNMYERLDQKAKLARVEALEVSQLTAAVSEALQAYDR